MGAKRAGAHRQPKQGGRPPNPRPRSGSGCRAARAIGVGAWVLVLALVVSACTTTRVEDLTAFETIPMNRVVPYPGADEWADRSVEVAILNRSKPGLSPAALEDAQMWTKAVIETAAQAQGAALRSDGWTAGETFAPTSRLRALGLTSQFETLELTSTWKKPFKFLWQDEAEVQEKPGTCLHVAQVSMSLDATFLQPTGVEANRQARRFELVHSGEESVRGLDPRCPYSDSARRDLFERTLDEALSCLRRPLASLFAPRGHVRAHIRERETENDLFQMSLGRAQGIEMGEVLEIRREQRSATPSGELARSERVIATGVVSDQIEAQSAWMMIDVAESTEPILEGDVVRPLSEEGLLASLSGPNCGRILTETVPVAASSGWED